MKRLIAGMPGLSAAEMKILAGTSPHAFRHTFGTLAVAEGDPLDVAQRILGHASLQTTSIY
jgi:integrase